MYTGAVSSAVHISNSSKSRKLLRKQNLHHFNNSTAGFGKWKPWNWIETSCWICFHPKLSGDVFCCTPCCACLRGNGINNMKPYARWRLLVDDNLISATDSYCIFSELLNRNQHASRSWVLVKRWQAHPELAKWFDFGTFIALYLQRGMFLCSMQNLFSLYFPFYYEERRMVAVLAIGILFATENSPLSGHH